MNRIEEIRAAEKASHEEYYKDSKLFEAGSWWSKPAKTVMEILPMINSQETIRVLDLGCGAGRNSIPVAKYFAGKGCLIDCVDLLDAAIEKLLEYSDKNAVTKLIAAYNAAIEDFVIENDTYDLMMAVSALEHVATQQNFMNVINNIKKGIKAGGFLCLIINSSVVERDILSGKILEAQFEVNMKTDTLQAVLIEEFADFQIIKNTVVPQEHILKRYGKDVLALTNVITMVFQK